MKIPYKYIREAVGLLFRPGFPIHLTEVIFVPVRTSDLGYNQLELVFESSEGLRIVSKVRAWCEEWSPRHWRVERLDGTMPVYELDALSDIDGNLVWFRTEVNRTKIRI